MPRYVEVSINLTQISGTYHYHLPLELEELVQIGSLVVVPFGKQTVQGVVLDFSNPPSDMKTLPIDSVLDEGSVLTQHQIDLAKWIAESTLAPLGACISLMIPSGLSQKADILASLIHKDGAIENLSETQKRLLSFLQKRGSMRGSQLEAAFRHINWRSSLLSLKQKGYIQTQSFLPPARISPKIIRKAQLAIPPERIDYLDCQLGRNAEIVERRRNILKLLSKDPLPTDFSWIYAQTGASYSDLKKLADDGLILFNETEIWRDPLESLVILPSKAPVLTSNQAKVWNKIQQALNNSTGIMPKPILLHGVTGSGKTEIYMQAVAEVIRKDKQAIVLVPEIALTPQTVRRFLARFPNQVGIYHSRLSEGERYDTWRRARNGDLKVVIGARSALFMPMPDLGLIVMDECDHESYDQDTQLPYYHGEETAEAYARLTGSLLLLGSATPRITQYYKAKQGEWELLTMPQRILAFQAPYNPALTYHELPKVDVIDMRQELKAGNRSPLSFALQNALKTSLDKGEQSILFLNRKGSATYVFCRECGYVLTCPRDDQPLTYHVSRSALICHICKYSRNMPNKCPNCGSSQIRQFGMGTEKLEELVKELLPAARTLRWDADTTTQKGAHDLILSHFSAHRADILIGTQMIAKGLDLPLVTLVGVVLAEVGLGLPDYRAPERTFQLLTQVSGRAGRSPLGGKVILQTYTPENYAIQAASKHNFDSFYNTEIQNRLELNYPPYKRLIRMEIRHRDNARCESLANEMAFLLQSIIKESHLASTNLIGPVPCYYNRLGGLYRWQIIIRGPDPGFVIKGRSFQGWIIEVDPPNLL